MIRHVLWVLLFLPMLWGFKHIPQGATEEILLEAQAGQTLIFQRKYGEAQKHFTQLMHKYPDSPLGSFGLMAVYNTIMFEDFDFSLDKAFEQISYNNQIVVEKIASLEDASAWDSFLCGASSGLRSFYYIRKDKAFKALGESKISKKCIEKAQKKDPLFIDTYLGSGMYDYWRSVFTNSIKILPFFKDRRKEGIAQMNRAIAEGSIANELAQAALMFVYLQEGKSAEGLAVAEALLQKYPNNVIVLNHKGRFLSRMGKYPEAIEVFEKVMRENPDIHVTMYFKGETLRRMGKDAEAQTTFEAYLATKPSPAWQAYTHHQLGRIALKNNDRKKAWDHFKAGDKAYGDYSPNLQMILKMRKGEV